METAEENTKILLVDDSPENLLALEAALECLGQTLVLAHSGSEALRALLHSDFAAILLDVKMPDMDGFETAELIRARPRSRHTPIIFLTAFRGDEQLRRGYRLGAVDFLFKPVIPEILQSKVSVFVELSRIHAVLQRQAQVLRGTEEQFRLLLEAAPDPMIISTESGEIRLVNARTEELFEHPRKELIGQSIHLLLPAWRRDLDRSLPEGAGRDPLSPPSGSGSVEIEARARKRGVFPAEVTLSPLHTKDGLVIISAVRNVSERVESERKIRELNASLEMRVIERTTELRETNEALRRSNEDLNQFAYAASHDLREPLRIISVYSELLQRCSADQPKLSEYAAVVHEGARRMDRLLAGLLDYTKVESSETLVERVDCGAAMQEVVFHLQTMISETQADVTWEDLPVIQANRIHIIQLFQNLVENALKYRQKGRPVVRVRCERNEDRVLLSVSDNGIGIQDEYLRIIFGAFKRLHSHSEYSGAGIGLSLCQRIAEKYKGTIWAESDYGQGSRFFVRFPAELLSEGTETTSAALPDAV